MSDSELNDVLCTMYIGNSFNHLQFWQTTSQEISRSQPAQNTDHTISTPTLDNMPHLICLHEVLPCVARFFSNKQCLQGANSTEDRLPLLLALPQEIRWLECYTRPGNPRKCWCCKSKTVRNHLFNSKIKKTLYKYPFHRTNWRYFSAAIASQFAISIPICLGSSTTFRIILA